MNNRVYIFSLTHFIMQTKFCVFFFIFSQFFYTITLLFTFVLQLAVKCCVITCSVSFGIGLFKSESCSSYKW